MKNIITSFALIAASLIYAAPTLTIDSVTQRWPFSPKVDIAFTISDDDADGECYTLSDFVAYDGDRSGTLDETTSFEDLQMVYAEGSHTLVFDPTATALTNVVDVQHFSIGFDVSSAPVRYMMLDLTKSDGEDGEIEYIYEGDSRLETFTQAVSYLDGDTEKETTIQYDDAFLTITNKTLGSDSSAASEYAINKIVFRLVKPGNYRVGPGSVSSSYNSVTLTKPYFISTSLLTRGQYGCIRYGDYAQKDSGRDATYSNQTKSEVLYLDDLRGPHGDSEYPVDWIEYGHYVCPTSFLGKARTKYGLAFDIPTETQWEVAARAGTTGYYYVDADLSEANTNLLDKIGYVGSSAMFTFGNKLANAWGLFDMLGNGQSVLDNALSGTDVNGCEWPSGTDPVGAYSTWWGYTFSKGGGPNTSSIVACGNRGGHAITAYANNWTNPYYNRVRLVINVD